MITYSTAEAGTLALSSAPAIAIAPRSLPEKSFSEPINLPIGVRAPATITDVVMTTSRGGLSADPADLRSRIFLVRLPLRYDHRSSWRPSSPRHRVGDGGRPRRHC